MAATPWMVFPLWISGMAWCSHAEKPANNHPCVLALPAAYQYLSLCDVEMFLQVYFLDSGADAIGRWWFLEPL